MIVVVDDIHMSSSLEDIEFLARSPHRVEVLDALSEAPRTRHELKERADVSRVTIRRLLSDLEERGWVEDLEGQYETTTRGRIVSQEFSRLQANLSVTEELSAALPWLPTEEFDFDLAYLRDADVRLSSSWENQQAIIRHAAELVDGTSTIEGTAIGFSHEVVAEIREGVVDGPTTFDVVIDEPCLRMIRNDSGLRDHFEAILGSDAGSLRRYTGEAPLHMVVSFDDLVSICGHVDDGPPPGSLESTHPRVRSWAESYYDRARAQSDPIALQALVPDKQGPS